MNLKSIADVVSTGNLAVCPVVYQRPSDLNPNPRFKRRRQEWILEPFSRRLRILLSYLAGIDNLSLKRRFTGVVVPGKFRETRIRHKCQMKVPIRLVTYLFDDASNLHGRGHRFLSARSGNDLEPE